MALSIMAYRVANNNIANCQRRMSAYLTAPLTSTNVMTWRNRFKRSGSISVNNDVISWHVYDIQCAINSKYHLYRMT